MSTVRTTRKTMSNPRNLICVGLSLGLLISLSTSFVPAFADEGLSAQAAGLGLDQDSLLPPEVVPLDASAASKMAQSEAQSRAADMTSNPTGTSTGYSPASNQSAPGMSPAAQGMSAQDFRKAAFDSLYNQGTPPANFLTQQNPNLLPQQPQSGQMPNYLGGTHQSGWQGANSPPQTQMLTGSASKPKKPNEKVKAISRLLATTVTVGGTVLVGAMMMRTSSPQAALGMGLMGSSMLNYGLRSGF
jgi:hypothetical protein